MDAMYNTDMPWTLDTILNENVGRSNVPAGEMNQGINGTGVLGQGDVPAGGINQGINGTCVLGQGNVLAGEINQVINGKGILRQVNAPAEGKNQVISGKGLLRQVNAPAEGKNQVISGKGLLRQVNVQQAMGGGLGVNNTPAGHLVPLYPSTGGVRPTIGVGLLNYRFPVGNTGLVPPPLRGVRPIADSGMCNPTIRNVCWMPLLQGGVRPAIGVGELGSVVIKKLPAGHTGLVPHPQGGVRPIIAGSGMFNPPVRNVSWVPPLQGDVRPASSVDSVIYKHPARHPGLVPSHQLGGVRPLGGSGMFNPPARNIDWVYPPHQAGVWPASGHISGVNSALAATPEGYTIAATVQEKEQEPVQEEEQEIVQEEKQEPVQEEEQEPVIDIIINNVVCTFSTRCHLNLKRIAMEGMNVMYKKEQGMVSMKIRNPGAMARIWASGKISTTGSNSEDNARVSCRKVARCLQRLGFNVRFTMFQVVNVLGCSSFPFAIRLVQFTRAHEKEASYEPELHPGVTYRIKSPKATVKIFSTGSITVTAPSVANIQAAMEHIYPLVYEFRVERPQRGGQRALPTTTGYEDESGAGPSTSSRNLKRKKYTSRRNLKPKRTAAAAKRNKEDEWSDDSSESD